MSLKSLCGSDSVFISVSVFRDLFLEPKTYQRKGAEVTNGDHHHHLPLFLQPLVFAEAGGFFQQLILIGSS